MALANDLQNDIAAVLDDPNFGRTVTLRRSVPGSYDEATGTGAAATVTNFPSRAILMSYKDEFIDGSNIRGGDRKAVLKAKNLGTIPQNADLLIAPETDATMLGTSTTSLAIGTGSKAFTTQAGKAWVVGEIVRAESDDSTKWMEGAVVSYSGTTLTLSIDASAGTGSHADWNIASIKRYTVISFKRGELGGTSFLFSLQVRR